MTAVRRSGAEQRGRRKAAFTPPRGSSRCIYIGRTRHQTAPSSDDGAARLAISDSDGLHRAAGVALQCHRRAPSINIHSSSRGRALAPHASRQYIGGWTRRRPVSPCGKYVLQGDEDAGQTDALFLLIGSFCLFRGALYVENAHTRTHTLLQP